MNRDDWKAVLILLGISIGLVYTIMLLSMLGVGGQP